MEGGEGGGPAREEGTVERVVKGAVDNVTSKIADPNEVATGVHDEEDGLQGSAEAKADEVPSEAS